MSRSIALVSGSFPPRVCGIADYTSLLAGSLRGLGADVVVWTGDREAEAQVGRVAPVVGGWDASGLRGLVHALSRGKPGVVHLQFERSIYNQQPAVSLLLPLLLRRAGLPLVTTFHALDGTTRWGRAHRAALLPLLLLSQGVVVCSHRQLKAVHRLPGVGRRTTLIPIGSSIPVTHTRAVRGGKEALRFVYFGFVWRGRNIEVCLRALAAVRGVPGVEEATLNIIGGIRDAEYQAELESLATDLGIREHLRFRGDLPADVISRELATADGVLLPFASGASTGRTTLIAALAHGAPVVTMGNTDNLSPLFVDGENLSIAPAGDDDAFIERTLALARDASLRARLSEGGARLAEQFSWSRIAEQTLALPAYRAAGVA